MRHIYYYYRNAEGDMEIPACEEFTGLRDNALRALAAKFRGSVTPITRVLGEFSSPGDAANFAAALEAQLACTPQGRPASATASSTRCSRPCGRSTSSAGRRGSGSETVSRNRM